MNEPEAICNRCHAEKGLHAVGESCNGNCGGKVIVNPRAGERCLCGWTGGQWITPPSCPWHGIRHLRDARADKIAVHEATIYADLQAAERARDEALTALQELRRGAERAETPGQSADSSPATEPGNALGSTAA